MKRAEVVLSLAAVAAGTAYVLGSPAAALVATAILAHYSMARLGFRPGIRVERRVPERGTELEPLKASILVENLSRTPGFVRIRELSRKVFARELRSRIGPGERRHLHQTIVPRARGKLKLLARATFEDELGLFVEEFPVVERGEITVFPSQMGIAMAMKERARTEFLSEVESALGIGAETLEFQELREFLPGDSLTRIDWKATSRIQKPIVRVFKRESIADVYLLINIDKAFRRELRREKVDYLALILAQLVAYFRRFGHSVHVVAYDGRELLGVINSVDDPYELIRKLDLREERGLPVLRPIRTPDGSHLGKLLSGIGGSASSGPVKAALRVPSGSYVLVIDDIGLHPGELMKAARILRKKGSRSALVYPNPVLFFRGKPLDERTLEALYRAYRERKMLLKRFLAWIKVVEVGPGDLLPAVVRRL